MNYKKYFHNKIRFSRLSTALNRTFFPTLERCFATVFSQYQISFQKNEQFLGYFVYLCNIMKESQYRNGKIKDKKRVLLRQLEQSGCLWSYSKDSESFDDNLLIEKALLYLEFEDLHRLCELYPMKRIQRVWREKMVSQGDYYGIINWLLAVMFFDIKEPEKYLKRYGKTRLEIRA